MTIFKPSDKPKHLAESLGYRFEVDADGTERMIRPDGSVAMIARKKFTCVGCGCPVPIDTVKWYDDALCILCKTRFITSGKDVVKLRSKA